MLPRHDTRSATKARDPSVRPATGSSSTGITVVKQADSRWQKQWADMQSKVSHLAHMPSNVSHLNRGTRAKTQLLEKGFRVLRANSPPLRYVEFREGQAIHEIAKGARMHRRALQRVFRLYVSCY